MDVITFVSPENNVRQDRFPPQEREPLRARAQFAALAEIPAAGSFPVLFLFAACVLLAFAPVLQSRVGFYRLDRMDMPSDDASAAAMRELVTPEPDASLLADATASSLPDIVKTVTYSDYKVRKGDTMGGILSRFGLRNLSTILSVNRIDSVKRIPVGKTLSVPSMDGIAYTVGRGDSLAKIAARYSVGVNAILDANDLQKETLVAGQKLFIPGATLSASELRRALGSLFILPVKGARMTSNFGWRADPFTGVRTFHTGIDLASPIGTPIKASMEGTVATTGFSSVFGNYVILSHDGGYQTLYGHMSSIGVSRGQRVAQGSVIGKVGSTGYSTGSHCHFSVYKNGKMLNPYSVLN